MGSGGRGFALTAAPVFEVMRSQQAPASVYDPIVLRAAGRRLVLSSVLLLASSIAVLAKNSRR